MTEDLFNPEREKHSPEYIESLKFKGSYQECKSRACNLLFLPYHWLSWRANGYCSEKCEGVKNGKQ